MTVWRFLLILSVFSLSVSRACRVCIANAGKSLSLGSLLMRRHHVGSAFFENHPTPESIKKQLPTKDSSLLFTSLPDKRPPRSKCDSNLAWPTNGAMIPWMHVPLDSASGEEDDSQREQKSKDDDEDSSIDTTEEQDSSDPASVAMLASLSFYKRIISPLLPPACRFVPTCSQYGVQAIQELGPTKGVVLIAWRLLRCSPIGGKGYDPPR